MLTLILLLIPLIASFAAFLMPDARVKQFALLATLAELCLTTYTFFFFKSDIANQFGLNLPWVESLGISFKVGIDGISLLLLALTNFLLPLIVFSSFRNEIKNAKLFYGLILFMQFALIGVFVALDGFLFYIFWELALLPIYFICLLWGGEERIKITLKFFIYTLTGSLFMLLGLLYLYLQTPGAHTFDIDALYAVYLSQSAQGFLFWVFFLAFAIKIPIFPLHTWQPDTYTDAPTQGTMLLSGIMLKMGIYGLIRWMIPIVPDGIAEWGNLAMILSVIGIVYASCMALVQNDFKRLIAYSSIAHVGLIAAGVFSLNIQGLQGAMFQMLSHGVNVIGLFFIVDIIERRLKTRDLNELGGLAHNSPLFTILFMVILLGSVALPLTNGFVGEFLLLNGIYQYSAWMAAIAGLTIILGAVYMLRAYQKVMLGEVNSKHAEFTRLHLNERVVLITVATIIVITGIYPKPILQVAQPALEEILLLTKSVY